jgi:hypothetical protein
MKAGNYAETTFCGVGDALRKPFMRRSQQISLAKGSNPR